MPLTHLTLAFDDEMPWTLLSPFLLSLSPTLASLAIRQSTGTLSLDPSTTPSLNSTDLPHLTRLALTFPGDLLSILSQFLLVDTLNDVEIGAFDPDFTGVLVRFLTGTEGVEPWPQLATMSYTAPVVGGDDWVRLCEICEERGVEFWPGYDVEQDWPERFR